MSSGICLPLDKLNAYNMQLKTQTLRKVEKYVLLTTILFLSLFFLNALKKRFTRIWLKLLSWTCYILVPILISYTMGMMGQPKNSIGGGKMFYSLYAIWTIFILFPYASFDSLSAFSLNERDGRSKLLLQFLIQFALLSVLLHSLSDFKNEVLPILLVFPIVLFKVVERVAAMAHSAGATPGVRRNVRMMIDYMNQEAAEDVDPVTMRGFNYLVGPRHSTVQGNRIVDGVTLEKMHHLIGDTGNLKDTCLSFSLFWLLLGKFWGYPLYHGDSNSRTNAWKFVSNGLLGGGEHDYKRGFKVIEIELAFLRDYFYSKYIFFYLNGFFWKLYVLAFPVMVWWFTLKEFNYDEFNSFYLKYDNYNPKTNPRTTATVTLIISSLELIQLSLLVASNWFKVALLSYYAKREMSSNHGLLHCCLGKVVGSICRISQSRGKPWKRELDQYSLLKSCNSMGVENPSLQAFGAVLGLQLPKPGRGHSESVVLSDDVKRAVFLSLQTNGPTLSNGLSCLTRSGMEEELSWACKPNNNAENILVWHIATTICEMQSDSQGKHHTQPMEDFLVATSLSNYCAYLLAFAPELLPVSLLEAESMCDMAITEARDLFKKSGHPPCGSAVEKLNKYDLLMDMSNDTKEEVEGQRITTLQKGVKLGKQLVHALQDERKRWKVLAKFWAEMMLFLAPSNNNEMDHAQKLVVGGEFITHIWTLLIHAGITERQN